MKSRLSIIFIVFICYLLSGCKSNAYNSTNVKTIDDSTNSNIPYTETTANSGNIVKKGYSYNKNTRTLTINIKGEMKTYHYNEPWIFVKHPEHLVLNKGVTSISDYAFAFSVHGNGGERLNNYDRIKTVSLPTTVVSIGEEAFSYCKNLKSINIPKSVKNIGECAFGDCKNLKKITIPGTVKTIKYGTFIYCDKLKKVKLKKGIITIGKDAFSYCSKLESINLPNTITTIKDAFVDCKSLKKINLPKKIKAIKGFSFAGCEKLKSVSFSKKIEKIGEYAFINCKTLKKVSIPKNVKTIGKKAFGFVYTGKVDKDGTVMDAPIKDFTIKGYKGTAAEKYAKENGFKFIVLD